MAEDIDRDHNDRDHNDQDHNDQDHGDQDHGESSGLRGPIIALVVTVVLVVAGWWIAGYLKQSAQLQDCLMARRSNCAPVQ